MVADVKDAFRRSAPTLVQDAAGALSLAVILLAGLALPSLF